VFSIIKLVVIIISLLTLGLRPSILDILAGYKEVYNTNLAISNSK
jgi:hypothetical protein